MTNAHQIKHVILLISFQPYKIDVHILPPRHSTMTTRRKRSSAASEAPATRKKRMEQLELLEPTEIYTY